MKKCLILFIAVFLVIIQSGMKQLTAQQNSFLNESCQEFNINTYSKTADSILIGTVIDMESQVVTNKYGDKLILSDVTILVDEDLKDNIDQNERLTIKDVVGGTIGEISMRSSSDPFFQKNERTLTFLVQRDNLWSVLGGDRGKFTVDQKGEIVELGKSMPGPQGKFIATGKSLEQFKCNILQSLQGLK